MYETLPNLVNTVGEAFIIENLSSYIINIDTNLAMNRHKNKNVHGFVKVFDFDIDFEKDTLTSVIYKLKNDITFGILDDKNEMIYFIKLFFSQYIRFIFNIFIQIFPYRSCYKFFQFHLYFSLYINIKN